MKEITVTLRVNDEETGEDFALYNEAAIKEQLGDDDWINIGEPVSYEFQNCFTISGKNYGQ